MRHHTWCGSPMRVRPRASSPCARRRAAASGSTAPALPPSLRTPTPSRSMKTWCSRSTASPITAKASSASISSSRSRTSCGCSTRWKSTRAATCPSCARSPNTRPARRPARSSHRSRRWRARTSPPCARAGRRYCPASTSPRRSTPRCSPKSCARSSRRTVLCCRCCCAARCASRIAAKWRRCCKTSSRARPSSAYASASTALLNVTDPSTIKQIRKTMIEWGFNAQKSAHNVAKKQHQLGNPKEPPPNTTNTKPPLRAQELHFIKKPLPTIKLPTQTMRALLVVDDNKFVPVLLDPAKVTDDSDAVFYFPGCGSERLFSQIGLATLASLYEIGTQTILPPGYLCCGYPQTSGGDVAKGQQITTENRVLFHRVANALNYLDVKTVIVSCGTCMDQLLKYEFQQIFPGCRLLDIHEYLMEKGVSLEGVTGVRYIYHDPCHTPMKTHNPITVAT